MTQNSEYVFKLKGKDYQVWKPDKLIVSKQMKEVLGKTT